MKKKVFKIALPTILVLINIGLIVCLVQTKPQKISEEQTKNENIDNTIASKERNNTNIIGVFSSIEENMKESLKVAQENLKAQKEEEKRLAEEQAAIEAEEKRKQAEAQKTTTDETVSLNSKANNIANSYGNTTRIEYGTSYQGRPLEAYLIKGNGSNSKTIFMECEVHGFEDSYAKDGKILVNLGNDLVEYYANNPGNLGDYQMIVVPSANPDGVIEGVNNTRVGNGYCFGRCTAAGIDMNRDFRNGYFQAQESQALRSLMNQYPMNIHLDFHGWENSVIGDQTIVNNFLAECGITYNKGGRWGSGQGYVIEYTKNTFGAHSAIVEFRDTNSVNSSQVESALNKIMQQL